MIKKILKWVGIVVGGLIVLIVVALLILILLGTMRINKDYDVQVASIEIPTDQAAIERGRHFVETIGICSQCHGEGLRGDILSEDAVFGTLAPPNLTSGVGGIGGTLNDEDILRAIRHGIGRDGEALMIMPSDYFNRIGDADLGAIVAYIKSLPPVDNEVPETSLAPLGRVVALLSPGGLLSAREIDHVAPRPPDPVRGVTAEYGKYLATICSACHGENLSGRSVPWDFDAPLARNLTPKGVLVSWSESDFINTLRTGSTPGGGQLDGEFMSWEHFARMTDDELKALWLYVKSLPPKEFGE